MLHKEGQVDQYINVLPESIKKTLKPQNLTESPYRTMLTKELAGKASFLGFLGITVSDKSLLEVSINDRWRLDGPSFWGDNELKKNVMEVGKAYASLGYRVSYNQNVQYSTLVTSEFRENSGDVKSAFSYVDASGRRFIQSSNYSQRELISIAAFDITPILNGWNPGATPAVAAKVNQAQIEDAIVNRQSGALKLNGANVSELQGISSRISSEEFKTKIFK